MKTSAIILAAGKSSRMGFDKALLKYGKKHILELLYNKLKFVCDDVIIVLGQNYSRVVNSISGIPKQKMVFNPNHEQGMSSSIKAGIKHLNECSKVFVQMIDQPFVSVKIYQKLLEKKVEFCLQPVFNKQKAHPLLFDFKAINGFLNFDSSKTLRDYLHYNKQFISFLTVNTKAVLHNLNTKRAWKEIEKNYK